MMLCRKFAKKWISIGSCHEILQNWEGSLRNSFHDCLSSEQKGYVNFRLRKNYPLSRTLAILLIWARVIFFLLPKLKFALEGQRFHGVEEIKVFGTIFKDFRVPLRFGPGWIIYRINPWITCHLTFVSIKNKIPVHFEQTTYFVGVVLITFNYDAQRATSVCVDCENRFPKRETSPSPN